MGTDQIMTESRRPKAFCYVDKCEWPARESYSTGRGGKILGIPDRKDFDVPFSVSKDRTALYIRISGERLIKWLRETIPCPSPLDGKSELTLSHLDLLPNYPALKSSLIRKERAAYDRGLISDELIELRLFVRVFLLDRSMFQSFGFENLQEDGVLTPMHFQDMQYYYLQEDLDYLDECMDLALCSNTDLPHDADQTLQLDTQTQSELQRAIRQRDSQTVTSLLAQNSGYIDSVTLTTATKFYDSSIFSLLLRRVAMVNREEILAEPLYVAAKCGHIDAVKALLQYGANKEGVNPSISATPLTGAASGGDLATVQYLVESGANVHGNCSKSPISRAIKHGHMDIVIYLVQHGADIVADVGEDVGNFLFRLGLQQMACPDLTVSEIASDLECSIINLHADDSKRPLFVAGYLRDHGSGISKIDCEKILSYVATDSRVYPIVKESLLRIARRNGDHDLWVYLRYHGVAASGIDYPVRSCTENDHLDGSFNSRFMQSSLVVAAEHGWIDSIKDLVGQGAILDAGIKDTLRYAAEGTYNLDIIDYLAQHGEEIDVDAFERILSLHQDFRSYDNSKDALLFYSVDRGYIGIVNYLVTHGADLDRYGDSLLCAAWERGHRGIVDLLIRHGHHSGIAGIMARERCKIGRKLLRKLSKSHNRLMDASGSSSASIGFALLGAQLGTCESLWEKGTHVIRNLMDGHLPSRLLDVLSCLLVANAMRSAVSDPGRSFSKQEFINDIPRWIGLIVPEEETLFKEIVSCLWGRSWELDDASVTQSSWDNLWYFQELVSKLVRQCGQFASIQKNHFVGGHRQQCPQQRHSPTPTESSQLCKQVTPPVGRPPPGLPSMWNDDIPEQSFRMHSKITVLMAGAIFGVIFLGLCSLRYGSSALWSSLAALLEGQDFVSNQVLVRNISILTIYLGISTVTPASNRWTATNNEFSDSARREGDNSYAATLQRSPPEHIPQILPLNDSNPGVTPNSRYPQSYEERLSPVSGTETPSTTPTDLISDSPTANITPTTSDISLSEAKLACLQCPEVLRNSKLNSFSTRSNLNRHNKRFHSAEAEMFFCRNYRRCAYGDKCKGNVKKHEKNCKGKLRRRWKTTA